jgi:hypothetical protein
MKRSRSRSSDAASRYSGNSQVAALVNDVFARLDKCMPHEASNQVVECPRDERLESHGHEDACHASAAPRERWSWTTWLGPVTVSVLGVLAVGIVVSAITVVSREPFGPTGAVIPTRPLTTTTAPPPASSAAPIPPPVTRTSSAAPPAIAPTTVQTSAPAPPQPRTTHPSSTRSQPSSARPTTHQPFPQETTDFLGPPGTNN